MGETLQTRVRPWMLACFGEAIAGDVVERNHRFLEEALELVQACGCSEADAHALVEYVYRRPAGDKAQEAGGVMITLAALCLAQGLDMHEAGDRELERVWTKVEAIRAKQATKPRGTALPASAAGFYDWETLLAIVAERRRQVEAEGFDAAHDDAHGKGELARAALNYVAAATIAMSLDARGYEGSPPFDLWIGPVNWPWSLEWWKPKDVTRDLERAAALLLAELARLSRAAKRVATSAPAPGEGL